MVWGIAAAFTATTIIVLAAVQFVTPLGAANGTAQLTLGYPLLVKALLVAMIARMRILWLTIPVGIALGIVEVVFQQNVTGIDANVFSLWLFLATLVVVLTLAPRARVASDTEPSWKLSGRVKPLPERVRGVWIDAAVAAHRDARCPRWCSCSSRCSRSRRRSRSCGPGS